MNRKRAFLLLFLVLLGPAARSESTSGNSLQEQRLSFEVSFEPGEIIGREQVVREIVTCGTNRFLIVLPSTMRCESSRTDSLALVSTDSRYSISFSIFRNEEAGTDPQPDLKDRTLALYPGAQNMEDFPVNIAGKDSRAIRFRQKDPMLGERVVKVVRVPCKAGQVEFVLNTSTKAAKEGLEAMDAVLIMFRTNEAGKLEILKRSEGS